MNIFTTMSCSLIFLLGGCELGTSETTETEEVDVSFVFDFPCSQLAEGEVEVRDACFCEASDASVLALCTSDAGCEVEEMKQRCTDSYSGFNIVKLRYRDGGLYADQQSFGPREAYIAAATAWNIIKAKWDELDSRP